MKHFAIIASLLVSLNLSAANLLLHYDFNESTTTYQNKGSVNAPLVGGGSNQRAGDPGSGVSGSAGDRAWDSSANEGQGATGTTNNSRLQHAADQDALDAPTAFTIAFWYKLDQSMDNGLRLVYKSNRTTHAAATPLIGYALRSLTNGFGFMSGDDSGNYTEILSSKTVGYNVVGKWIFVAITWDGAMLTYYYGDTATAVKEAGGGALAGPIGPNTTKFTLANTSSNNRGLDGWLDNFRFYDGPLSMEELEALRLEDGGEIPEPEPEPDPTPGVPVRPLADSFTLIGPPMTSGMQFYSPSILSLSGSLLVSAYTVAAPNNRTADGVTQVWRSADTGSNWTLAATLPMTHARLFRVSSTLYLIGQEGNIVISKSSDSGQTWSEPVAIDSSHRWHQSSGNVFLANGKVYAAFDRRVTRTIGNGLFEDSAPILFCADQSADLLSAQSWSLASELSLRGLVPGATAEAARHDYFPIPFEPNTPLRKAPYFEQRATTPLGWLHPNVVQIVDENHYWYDTAKSTYHILLRANTGRGGDFGALVKVTDSSGTLTTSPQTVESGKRMVFLPLPGGENPIHITYDSSTRRYWLLTSEEDVLPRNLTLYFSKNLVDWCFAGLVAKGGSASDIRHNAAMHIQGENLHIISVNTLNEGQAQSVGHHVIPNFRMLVY